MVECFDLAGTAGESGKKKKVAAGRKREEKKDY